MIQLYFVNSVPRLLFVTGSAREKGPYGPDNGFQANHT